MQPWPDTSDSLIVRLQNPADRQAWDEFASLYEPLIFRVARRGGLQDADARDITQRVLWSVARAADRWEPGTARGRFRGWLATVTRNAVINMVHRESEVRGTGLSAVWEQLKDTPHGCDDISAAWTNERRLALFRHANVCCNVCNRSSQPPWRSNCLRPLSKRTDSTTCPTWKTNGAHRCNRSSIRARKVRYPWSCFETPRGPFGCCYLTPFLTSCK